MPVSLGSPLYYTYSDARTIFTVNKQLNDKERVAAALENPALVEVLEQCLAGATV